jgi:transposase InsO family protein
VAKKRYSEHFRQVAVERMRGCENIVALTQELGVSRMMREDNLLAVQPRQFVVTTNSDHQLEVYLNLARRMKLSGINQLWVADIT